MSHADNFLHEILIFVFLLNFFQSQSIILQGVIFRLLSMMPCPCTVHFAAFFCPRKNFMTSGTNEFSCLCIDWLPIFTTTYFGDFEIAVQEWCKLVKLPIFTWAEKSPNPPLWACPFHDQARLFFSLKVSRFKCAMVALIFFSWALHFIRFTIAFASVLYHECAHLPACFVTSVLCHECAPLRVCFVASVLHCECAHLSVCSFVIVLICECARSRVC